MCVLAKKLSALVELLLGEPGDGVGRVGRRLERSEGEERDSGEPVRLDKRPEEEAVEVEVVA